MGVGQIKPNRRERTREQTCLVVPAAHHILNHIFPIERIFVSHDAQCRESPINGVHPQVCGEMISEIIFVLYDVKRRTAERMRGAHVSE